MLLLPAMFADHVYRPCYYRFVVTSRTRMRFVILHYHFFKNAGSTIEDILDHSFGERFGQLETPDGSGLISNYDLLAHLDSHPELRAFSSHQIRYPMPQTPGYLFFDLCFLRDPIDRLRSFYDYFRQRPNPADPMSDLANRSTPGEFVAGMLRDFPLFVRNNQVNLLACGGDSDEPGESDLQLAVHRMMSASFLGVVDEFGRSTVAGTWMTGQAFPELDCGRPAVNVSRGMRGSVESRTAELREACDPAVFAELIRVTELDRRLVERARAEVARRFDGVERGVAVPAAGYEGKECARVPGRRLRDWAAYYRVMRRPERDLFDAAFYLDRNADVRAAGIDPFVHYIQHGAAEGRKPHPLFEPEYFRASGGAGSHPLFAGLGAVDYLAWGVLPIANVACESVDAATVIPLDLWDVVVVVFALAAEPGEDAETLHTAARGRAAGLGLRGSVALVWRDAGGATQWIAETQQMPFFRGVSFDQVLGDSSR